jgi:hypothetical protein
MGNIVKVQASQLPAAFAPFVGKTANKELTDGVTSGFPIISFRGKVWRVRKSGTEENYVNDEGEAMPSIELVLIRANPHPAKTFYDSAFEEGSNEPPRCFSADGIKPDASVQEPISRTCAACPKNVWGSKLTPSGAKSRACSDVRRMAVVFAHELEEKGKEATLLLLRVPPASLNPLKDYAEKMLEPRGLQYFMLVTKVGFDANVAHPKLTFKPKRLLNEEEAEAVVALRDSEDARRILAEAAEFEAAGSTEGSEASATSDEATPAPAASSPSRKPKTRPAEEEDFEDEPAPPKKAKPAPAPAADDDDDEPPAPKPKGKKAKPAPAPAADDDDDDGAIPAPKPAKAAKAAPPPAAADDDEDSFEGMLDAILKPVKG